MVKRWTLHHWSFGSAAGMALQPNLAHEAENSSQPDSLLGLDLSNQDSLFPEAPLLGLDLSNQDSLLILEAPFLIVCTYSQTLNSTPYIVLTTTSIVTTSTATSSKTPLALSQIDLLQRQSVSIRDSSLNNPLIKCHHLHSIPGSVRSTLQQSQTAASSLQRYKQLLNGRVDNTVVYAERKVSISRTSRFHRIDEDKKSEREGVV
jgi:hypothetical protein